MFYDDKAEIRHCHEEDEESPMFCDHSKEELVTSKGAVPGRESKAGFTKEFAYGMLLTCTVLTNVPFVIPSRPPLRFPQLWPTLHGARIYVL